LSWIDEDLDYLEARGLITRDPPGARGWDITPVGMAALGISDAGDVWAHLAALLAAAEGMNPTVQVTPFPNPLSDEEISQRLDVCEAAGFIQRRAPDANDFDFTPMGFELLRNPDPAGRDWMQRMLDAAATPPLT
jgi:hypothetical protein